jgi:peptide/nickel transport system permease protein
MDSGAVVLQESKTGRLNQRRKLVWYGALAAVFLSFIAVSGAMLGEKAVTTHSRMKNLHPSAEHPFGTDWLGRDMLARTLKGLSISIMIGIFASAISAILAGALGAFAAGFGRKADISVSFAINVVMGLPHILLLLLISYALGKGMFGIIFAVAVSHWPSLARVLRGEILQLREANYVKIAAKLGQSKLTIAKKHMAPHIFPQFLVGLILLFPHAILHEASLTFLGFGLRPEQPGIGIILSESMKYLSLGMWHLALFPGLALLLTVLLFDVLGSNLRKLLDPHSAQK